MSDDNWDKHYRAEWMTGEIDFPEDVARIKQVLEARGTLASDYAVQAAWAEFSDKEYCASWVTLDKDDNALYANATRYLRLSVGR